MALRNRRRYTRFRSSFKDWTMELTDTPWAISEAALAHTLRNSKERAYTWSDWFERSRVLMQLWANCASSQARLAQHLDTGGYHPSQAPVHQGKTSIRQRPPHSLPPSTTSSSPCWARSPYKPYEARLLARGIFPDRTSWSMSSSQAPSSALWTANDRRLQQ